MISYIILFVAVVIQVITGQSIGHSYYSPYKNELAADLVAEASALAYPGMAYSPMPYSAIQNPANPMPYPAFEGPLLGITGLNYGLSLAEISANNGCGLRVTSASQIQPKGVTILSDDMAIEGPLAVTGHIPFLGVVAVEGPLLATGAGSVAYGCGNGNVAMISEGLDAVTPSISVYPPGYQGPGIRPNGVAF